MKTKLFLTTIIVLINLTLLAQMPVATLQQNGETSVYYGSDAFVDAYNTAVNGDSILLSAGAFNAPSSITKGIKVIGAGYRQDSSYVGKSTLIVGNIEFHGGANNAHIEGLQISSVRYYDSLENIRIKRCQISAVVIYTDSTSFCSIEESVITNGFNGNNHLLNGFLLKQNIFYINSVTIGLIISVDGLVIDNNIIIKKSTNYTIFYNCAATLCRNNIFIDYRGYDELTYLGSGGIIFYNNITNLDSTSIGDLNTGSNNYFSVPIEDIFVQAIGEDDYVTNSFQLQNPGTYLGIDGTQVGLYGTAIPFKESRFPSNPIVTSAEVDPQTDGSGHLNVSFTVEAQEN